MHTKVVKLFISYTHDSTSHTEQVLDISNTLRQDGIDVVLDQYILGTPSEGWPRWMERNLRDADHIAIVCSEQYCKRADGREAPEKGLGAKWETFISYQLLYDAETNNSNNKFIPILLSHEHRNHIPTPLRSATWYNLREKLDYDKLYRVLTHQPATPPPPLGTVRVLNSQATPVVDPVADFCRDVAASAMKASGMSRDSRLDSQTKTTLTITGYDPQHQVRYDATLNNLALAVQHIRTKLGSGSARNAMAAACRQDMRPLLNYLTKQRTSLSITSPNYKIQFIDLTRRMAAATRTLGDKQGHYKCCLDILEHDPDDLQSLDSAADVDRDLGLYDTAQTRYEHICELTDRGSPEHTQAIADLGGVHYDQVKLDSSELLTLDAIESFSRLMNRPGMRAMYSRLAIIAVRRGDFALARQMNESVRGIIIDGVDSSYLVDACTTLDGIIGLLSGDLPAARAAFDASLASAIATKQTSLEIAISKVNVALVVWSEGGKDEAIKLFGEAEVVFRKLMHNARADRVGTWIREVKSGNLGPHSSSIY